MTMHKLLIRQMNRFEINEDHQNTETTNWERFLQSIGNAYQEAEQERYLLERSIELSSNEYIQLTDKLETAQNIARLGYWSYCPETNLLILANNLYTLFGLKESSHLTNLEEFSLLIHEEDRSLFADLVTRVLKEKNRIECEIRVQNAQGIYNWYTIIGDSYEKEGTKLSGIAMDINNRKNIETELEVSNQQLVSTARFAGMADVAISVLHNIGNTLNSAGVAAEYIQEILSKNHFQRLSQIATLLKENESEIESYLVHDPKGKLLPSYIIALNEVLEKDIQAFQQEVSNLACSLNHVKEIIVKQQDISKVNTIYEKVFIPELLEDALKIAGEAFTNKDIQLHRDYENGGFLKTDKTKLTLILVNLIINAQDSVLMNKATDHKKIGVMVEKDQQNIKILVKDNGLGISPKNLEKLFSFGFTTKKNGHGFGLHSSILAAQEMGGELSVDSEGEGLGATFILRLPLEEVY